MATKKNVNPNVRSSKSSGPAKPVLLANLNKPVLLRTVTYHYLGRLLGVKDGSVMLDRVTWVADSGRCSLMLRDGVSAMGEYEVYPLELRVDIRLDTIVEIIPWEHALPTETK